MRVQRSSPRTISPTPTPSSSMCDTIFSVKWSAGKWFRSFTYRLLSSIPIFWTEQYRGSLLRFTLTLSWICGDLPLLVMLMVVITSIVWGGGAWDGFFFVLRELPSRHWFFRFRDWVFWCSRLIFLFFLGLILLFFSFFEMFFFFFSGSILPSLSRLFSLIFRDWVT